MDSEELISHPELQTLMKKFKKKFPLIPLEVNMYDLGRNGYSGMGLNVDEVKDILEKCLLENKYFKVWVMKWKGLGLMSCDWYEGKVAFYNYIESKLKRNFKIIEGETSIEGIFIYPPQMDVDKLKEKIKRDGQDWWKY